MSEENRWGQDPQETDRNVPTEENALNIYGNADTGSAEEKNTDNNIDNRPLTHPYSAGRRMQESQRNSAGSSDTAGNSGNRTEPPRYAHYQVHQHRQGITQEEVFRRRNRGNLRHPVGKETVDLAEKQLQQFPLR